MTNAFTRGLKRLFGVGEKSKKAACSCCDACEEPKVDLVVETKSLKSKPAKATKTSAKKTVKKVAKKKATSKKTVKKTAKKN